MHNDKILNEIQMEAKKRISKAIVNDTNLTLSSMRQTFEGIRAFALEQVLWNFTYTFILQDKS